MKENIEVLFWWLASGTGALVLSALVLWIAGHALVRLLKLLKVWHTLLLIVAVSIKGKEYRDSLFWNAIREHIGDDSYEARRIASFANHCCPFEQDEAL